MFIHDHYKKLAIEAIKKDLKNFNEDCLEEIEDDDAIYFEFF